MAKRDKLLTTKEPEEKEDKRGVKAHAKQMYGWGGRTQQSERDAESRRNKLKGLAKGKRRLPKTPKPPAEKGYACGGKVKGYAKGGMVSTRGCGAAVKGNKHRIC